MTADILATVATGLAIIGYLELRLGKVEDRIGRVDAKIDLLTERYIHHLESHSK